MLRLRRDDRCAIIPAALCMTFFGQVRRVRAEFWDGSGPINLGRWTAGGGCPYMFSALKSRADAKSKSTRFWSIRGGTKAKMWKKALAMRLATKKLHFGTERK